MELRLNGRREVMRPGAHPCQLYTLDEDAATAAAAFLEMGARGDYHTAYVGPTLNGPVVSRALALRAAESDGEGGGTFEHLDVRAELLPQGRFDPYHLVSLHQAAIDRALASDRRGLCLVVDMTWLAGGTSSLEQVIKYEAVAETVFTYQARPIVVLAQYHHTRAIDSLAAELLRIHSLAVVGHAMRRNPQHLDAEEYLRHFIQPRPQPRATPSPPFALGQAFRPARLGRSPHLTEG
jgi:hypothetical protein